MPSPTFSQIDGVANEIFKQAAAISGIGQINAQNYVSAVQAALLFGEDFVTNSISQVLSRTIFAIRPYYEKIRGIEVNNIEYGNHVRKISMLEGNDFEEDETFLLENGQSVNDQVVTLPKMWQGNFYDQHPFVKKVTVLNAQFKAAMQNYSELQNLLSMIIQQAVNQMAIARDGFKRGLLCNAMASIIQLGSSDNIIHLLTEYNATTGKTYSAQDVMNPDIYPAFIQWAFSRIQNVSDFMTDRTTMFHTNPEAGYILRESPKNMQRGFMLSMLQNQIDSMAKAVTYHPDYMQSPFTEMVNFWQSPEARDSFNTLPQYMKPDGTLANTAEAVTQANVFGCILDRDMLGVTVCDEEVVNSRYNAAGRYYNTYWHFTMRYYMDNTENGVVFLLD